MLLFHVFMWWFTSRVHQRSASQTSQQLSTFIVKHRKLGHMWHSAQCKTPETGQHWSMLNLREFLSSPSAVWQTYWSWTNAVKKLHHPPCAFVWCVFSLQPWKACCERVRAKNALFLLHLKFEASNLFYSAFFIYLFFDLSSLLAMIIWVNFPLTRWSFKDGNLSAECFRLPGVAS